MKSISLSGLGKALHGEHVLTKLLENNMLIKRLRKLELKNKAWWGDADIGLRNAKTLAKFLRKVKSLEAIDLSGNAFAPKQSLAIMSNLLRSDTLIALESLNLN